MIVCPAQPLLPPPLPPDREAARLRCLQELGILDTGTDESLDNVVRTVADFFDMPIAVLSLVDRDRQYFKAKFGLDMGGTDRSSSICQYTICNDDLFVVEDLQAHPVLRNLPAVREDPHIRFYAGSPVRMHGIHPIGSLCIMSQSPGIARDGFRKLSYFSTIVSHLISHNYLSEDEQIIRAALTHARRKQAS